MSTRRQFIGKAAGAGMAAGIGLALRSAAFARTMSTQHLKLDFQSFAIRDWLIKDFPGTLAKFRQMGYSGIELTSFVGAREDYRKRGNYGPLADMPPSEIRRAISGAGLTCESSHFFPEEFEDAKIDRSAAWAHGLGLKYMVITSLPDADSADGWKRNYELLHRVSERVRRRGFQLGLHTDPAQWAPLDGTRPIDEILHNFTNQDVLLQLDFAGIIANDVDAARYIRQYPGRFRWLHLRDGVKPATAGAYVPALPLGQGVIDWKPVMKAAVEGGIHGYIIEMQTRPLSGAMDAYARSYQYVRALEI